MVFLHIIHAKVFFSFRKGGKEMVMNEYKAVGRLGRNPEMKDAGGKAFCRFSLAVPRTRKKGEVDWIDFTCWDGVAKYLCGYAKKGDEIFVNAYWRTSKSNKEGKNYDNSGFVVENLQIITPKKSGDKTSSVETKTEEVEEFCDLGISEELPDC